MADENMVRSTGAVCPLMVVDAASEAAETLERAFGDGALATISSEALAADWPDHVAARARTGGALIAEVEDIRAEDRSAGLRLAQGRLFGRPATAVLMAGALVFVLTHEDPETPVAKAA